ncbi:MAG TPA: phage tail protein [Clostridia bacterium]|nr:phage tail protein [Clostridia bacterium]
MANGISSAKYEVAGVFRFLVEIDGLLSGGFTHVSGLEVETEEEEYHEGGLNEYSHHIPVRTKYSRLVLRKGFASSNDLWDWYEQVTSGKISRKSGSIILLDARGQEICRWNFFDAYPVKWTGPELDSESSRIAVETLEIVHNGIKAITSRG